MNIHAKLTQYWTRNKVSQCNDSPSPLIFLFVAVAGARAAKMGRPGAATWGWGAVPKHYYCDNITSLKT